MTARGPAAGTAVLALAASMVLLAVAAVGPAAGRSGRGRTVAADGVVLLVDPFYHGRAVLSRAHSQGHPVLEAVSAYTAACFEQKHPGRPFPEDFILPKPDRLLGWLEERGITRVRAVLGDSDSSLATVRELTDALNAAPSAGSRVYSNAPPSGVLDKHRLCEMAAAAGLRAPRQARVRTPTEAVAFWNSLRNEAGGSGEALRVVVKPPRGVGSVDVHLCGDEGQVRGAVERIVGKPKYGASGAEESAVVQEFLEGPEYAVDCVSRDGEHKVVAVWKYDKRATEASRGPFVYYATCLVDPAEDPSAADAAEYVVKLLGVVGVKDGPSHTEAIVTASGPVVVEVNCRFHNADFPALVEECLGTAGDAAGAVSAVSATCASLWPEDGAWEAVPSRPPRLRKHGMIMHLVSEVEGRLRRPPRGMDGLRRRLPALMSIEVYAAERGDRVSRTVDITTDAGQVLIAHEDPAEVVRAFEETLAWSRTRCMHDVGLWRSPAARRVRLRFRLRLAAAAALLSPLRLWRMVRKRGAAS